MTLFFCLMPPTAVGGCLQILSKDIDNREDQEIPPTAVGGCLQILSKNTDNKVDQGNPTNGSWWMPSDSF